MKLFYQLLQLTCIVITSVISAVLYLKGEVNLSSLLIFTSLVSLTLWVKSNGLLQDKKITNDASPQEAHWEGVHDNLYHLINSFIEHPLPAML